ncbi:16S rRNA (guanine(966)-N(2))-methyltransferase RsmD [Marinomonas mediterranea]|uniref:16S rRNA (guanine(966)-N(2))-methyltransferase RsmD n=1 Tax=Marinomonas mediterranea TaxID=119864 RepID=UPI00234973FA|nr:16S rRNA (guanine(966)-N(2))-methyltransferase RsmD [Marinomonas mediterranea]WCN15186.1 16S rRNA (guanine(966)-N(2))-methyltransferase RsmD [Marinomonas mediterranea]
MKKNTRKPNAVTNKNAKLRIIGGEWRSRQLPIPEVEGLRPTPDRVRETVFNWLNFDIAGAHCADVFCGTGALGLEALSRGAASCIFVDANRAAAQQLKSNLNTLNATNAEVHFTSALTYLDQGPKRPLDIVFLDPPFRKGWLEKILPLLEEKGWLAPQALIYIERESESSFDFPSHWELIKEKSAGQLTYSLYKRN